MSSWVICSLTVLVIVVVSRICIIEYRAKTLWDEVINLKADLSWLIFKLNDTTLRLDKEIEEIKRKINE
mgnify:CR=1 FL=1